MEETDNSYMRAAENIFEIGVGLGIALGVVKIIDTIGRSSKSKNKNDIQWF